MRTGDEAAAFARSEHLHPSRDWEGWCYMFVRMCFDVEAKWGFGSAKEGFLRTLPRNKHFVSHGSQVPRAVPAYFETGEFWHVVWSIGGGWCWTTDFWRTGKVDRARIDLISQRWGPLRGWGETINDVRIWTPPPPPARVDVSLSDLQRAARQDPAGRQGHHTEGAYWDAIRVERMLAREGILSWEWVDGSFGTMSRQAYDEFRRRVMHLSGSDATGLPGELSLGTLCRRHPPFRMVA